MSPGPTRILILGGGFGGVYTALTLEQLLRHDLRRGTVELTLVNRENYMVFQPMLPEVISGSIGLVDTITPIRRLCPSTNLYTPHRKGRHPAQARSHWRWPRYAAL
jgi:NADH dehydrogenase